MSHSEDDFEDLKESNAIATKDNITNIVIRYNQDKECITNQIMDFYKNYKKVLNCNKNILQGTKKIC